MIEQRGVVVPLCSSTLLHALLDVAGEPVEALVESLGGGGAATLEEPGALTEGVEAELLGDIGGGHGLGEILLVGEDEEDGVAELILGKHLLELITGLSDTSRVVGVDDEDNTIGVLEVVTPEGAELILTSHIPHGELEVLVLDGLHVESDGGDGGDALAELQLVQDGGLTGGIETDHKDADLLLAEEGLEERTKGLTHLSKQ